MLLTIVQIIVALALIAAILFQMQGTGLSTAFGGAGEFYRSRRSAEKFLIYVTIVLVIAFAVLSVALLFPH